MAAALEMRPGRLEVRSALLVHKPRCSVGETAIGIGERLAPFGFEEEYPACAQPLEHVVDARAGADQLRLRRALQVGAAKCERPLEAAVLVEYDAWRKQCSPGQVVGEPVRARAVFRKR